MFLQLWVCQAGAHVPGQLRCFSGFVPLLLLVIRPLSVFTGLIGAGVPLRERAFAGWFGIRGIGSLYYLMHAVEKGVTRPEANLLTGLTLATIAVSVVAHGVSVTPLMNIYNRWTSRAG